MSPRYSACCGGPFAAGSRPGLASGRPSFFRVHGSRGRFAGSNRVEGREWRTALKPSAPCCVPTRWPAATSSPCSKRPRNASAGAVAPPRGRAPARRAVTGNERPGAEAAPAPVHTAPSSRSCGDVGSLRLRVQCLTNECVKQLKDGSLTIRLPLPLKAALERAAENERRSLSQTVGIAIEQYLEARGEWPPAESKQSRSTPARRR